VTKPDYVAAIICRVLSQGTASWSQALRLALVAGALAAAPIATIILIVVIR
jgi:hypothetical protein